ncbi:anthranilate synthase component I family protein [Chitinophaga lutea]|uniref:anthranilate synthase component I family protein n=1 Tax=Chitinophaga lutea TaxID=2488634 RepID=UPI001FE596BB|nr:anthranilate synthase component I family protein [Chitinophaga lutea]
MDNNEYRLPGGNAEALLAADAVEVLQCNAGTAFDQLRDWHAARPGWLFGHFAYDLKNETEKLSSANADGLGFPDLCFFRPRYVLQLQNGQVQIQGENLTEEEARNIFEACGKEQEETWAALGGMLRARMDRSYYLESVRALKAHIRKGDCYEVNFCREQFMETTLHSPVTLFHRLNHLSPAPFAAYYKLNRRYLVCSSPERFLQKKGDRLISQPIKGTAKRSSDPALDAALQSELRNSAKEQSENVMIVDLVRNDLSRTAVQGSVRVEELFGIYTFPQVHHMISTVSATLDARFHFTDAIRHAFPMGSMTGAPKVRVMELIEHYEKTRRGLFSGAIGYITPGGDFDFNVVIRSILYNAENPYISFQTGSAITFYSDPEKEFDECQLKAKALMAALGVE